MFTPGLKVEVRDVRIRRVAENVVVTFTQDFTTPSYRDTGKKLVTWMNTPAGWAIMREEMLDSIVQGGGGSVATLPGFFAALPEGVVLRSSIDESWLTPARRKVADALRRQVREGPTDPEHFIQDDFLKVQELNLPAPTLAMKGKRLFVTRVPKANEHALPPPCEVRITDIDVVNAGTPEFEAVRGPMGLDHIYGSFVLGRFDKPCPNAVWASETPLAPQYLPSKAEAVLERRVVGLFRGEPAYQKLQAEYLQHVPDGKHWDEADLARRSVQVMGDPASERLIFVEAYLLGGSNDFTTSLTVVFSAEAGEEPKLRSRGVVALDEAGASPRIAFDLEGDGELEVLTGPNGDDNVMSVVSLREEKPTRTQVYFAPHFMCGG